MQYTSLHEMFQKIFPNYNWNIYYFAKVPNGYLQELNSNHNEQMNLVKHLVEVFNITETKDWYMISAKQLSKVISLSIFDVMKIVKQFYPDLDLKYFQNNNTFAD